MPSVEKNAGTCSCATSDETAWCFAWHHAELAAFFRLTRVAPEALLELVDKARLMAAARVAGLDVPDTWAPATEEEAVALAAAHAEPLFAKPRLQFLANGGRKGERVEGAEAMARAWRRQRGLAAAGGKNPRLATTPVVQRYVAGTERIFTVDGFAAGPNLAFPVLGCVKRVQRPRGSGPGLVFEDAPVPA